jgi:hypothetical protein
MENGEENRKKNKIKNMHSAEFLDDVCRYQSYLWTFQ